MPLETVINTATDIETPELQTDNGVGAVAVL